MFAKVQVLFCMPKGTHCFVCIKKSFWLYKKLELSPLKTTLEAKIKSKLHNNAIGFVKLSLAAFKTSKL